MFKNKGKKCSIGKCCSLAFCKSYCTKHYQQMRLKGVLKQDQTYIHIPGFCKNIACTGDLFAKGLCQKCYRKERKNFDNE